MSLWAAARARMKRSGERGPPEALQSRPAAGQPGLCCWGTAAPPQLRGRRCRPRPHSGAAAARGGLQAATPAPQAAGRPAAHRARPLPACRRLTVRWSGRVRVCPAPAGGDVAAHYAALCCRFTCSIIWSVPRADLEQVGSHVWQLSLSMLGCTGVGGPAQDGGGGVAAHYVALRSICSMLRGVPGADLEQVGSHAWQPQPARAGAASPPAACPMPRRACTPARAASSPARSPLCVR